ncbi:hypothetical protein BC830DRAFT_1144517 [Chytriomyces sp. MP71]|nr:hypothetical protein BC830DRAFT_1144517 [Chytriomyces sp. MP71]
MVDEVSGVAGGSGEDVNSIRKEMAKLRGTLEDEKLKYAKAKEVIRVLKESFGAASDVGGEGESSDDALLDIDALLAGGGLTGTAKGVASQYAKALHDAIGRSVVDFDELVLLLGENNALKSKNSELVIRLEEQGKRLTTSINECKTLKESLEKSRESHKKDNAHHESSIRELKDKLHHVQHDMTRFTTESAYYQEMTTSYLTQFSRIEALASDWFDVKSEHHLQVEAQLMHNKGAHPHLNRLISFDGIFSRLVAMLKETKTSLQESQATVAKLGSKLEAVTESERGLHEACSHQTATLETVKAAHEAQRVRIVEMEREVVEESGRRHALENKLRKVVRAAMAMLEIPIDAELVGQIHRSGGSALGALGKGAAQSLHSRPSPNRDYVAA